MSGGRRNNFDGQQWREKVIRTRVNAALADLPPLERRLRYDEEYKRQTAIYEQERDEKKRARQARNAQRKQRQAEARAKNAAKAPIKNESETLLSESERREE